MKKKRLRKHQCDNHPATRWFLVEKKSEQCQNRLAPCGMPEFSFNAVGLTKVAVAATSITAVSDFQSQCKVQKNLTLFTSFVGGHVAVLERCPNYSARKRNQASRKLVVDWTTSGCITKAFKGLLVRCQRLLSRKKQGFFERVALINLMHLGRQSFSLSRHVATYLSDKQEVCYST